MIDRIVSLVITSAFVLLWFTVDEVFPGVIAACYAWRRR